MPLTVDTFRNLANSSIVSGRDIVVRGENEAQTARNRLNNFCQQGGGAIAPRQGGGVTVTVPAARRNEFFLAFQETNIIDEKHAGELPGRIARDQERARLDMEERERRRLAAAAPV